MAIFFDYQLATLFPRICAGGGSFQKGHMGSQ
jgi:hypothetical protein